MKTFIVQMQTPEGQKHSERFRTKNAFDAEDEAGDMFPDSKILSVDEGYRHPKPAHHFHEKYRERCI